MSTKCKRWLIVVGGVLYFLGFVFFIWSGLSTPETIGGWIPRGIFIYLLYLSLGTVGLILIIYKNNNGEGF